MTGVDGLDVGRQDEPTGDRRVVVELKALLIADRRDGPEGLSENVAGRQVVVAHTPRVRSAAGQRAGASGPEVQEPVDRVGGLIGEADVPEDPPALGRGLVVDDEELIEAVGDHPGSRPSGRMIPRLVEDDVIVLRERAEFAARIGCFQRLVAGQAERRHGHAEMGKEGRTITEHMADPAGVRPAVRIEHEEGEDGVEISQVAEAGARGRVRDRAAVDRAEDKGFIHETIDAVAAQERMNIDAVGGVELAEGNDEIGAQELLDLHVGQCRGASPRLGELEGEVGRDQGADVAVDALSETALPVEVDEQALPAEEFLGLDGPEVVELEPVGEGLAEAAARRSLVELREVRAKIDPLVEQGVTRAEPAPCEAIRRSGRRRTLCRVGRRR